MPITNYLTNSEELTSIANAIRAKTGSNESLTYPSGFVSAIGNISGGGSSSVSAPSKLINFIDYDGTTVASYTAEEFANLNALPANPSHTGLVAQGWNWTLAQIQSYHNDYPEGIVNVGQMYITESGNTEIDIELKEEALNPYLVIAPNGTVIVDWGDGSATDTLTGSSLTTRITVGHVYPSTGNYMISLYVQSGSFTFCQNSETYAGVLNLSETGNNSSRVYADDIVAIRLGNGIMSIGDNAFNNCQALTLLTIPSSVTNIRNSAFRNCYALTSLTIPSGVTSIYPTTFQNCYALMSLTIPSGVTSIGNSAFYCCYALTSLTIPSGVTSIGTSVFGNCNALMSLTIPSGITSIGDSAFVNCKALTSLTIPSDVTSIGPNAFSNCSALTSLTIPSGVTSIGTYTFSNCNTLTSLTIPSGVTSIGNNAFYCCYALTSLTIPSGITSIGASAFRDCYALTSLTIPSSVTSINTYTFSNCNTLTSLTIPSGVTSIGNNAFYKCYSVTEYHFQSSTPPTLGTNNFASINPLCKIYVPVGSLEAYQTATNWSSFASYMEEEPE